MRAAFSSAVSRAKWICGVNRRSRFSATCCRTKLAAFCRLRRVRFISLSSPCTKTNTFASRRSGETSTSVTVAFCNLGSSSSKPTTSEISSFNASASRSDLRITCKCKAQVHYLNSFSSCLNSFLTLFQNRRLFSFKCFHHSGLLTPYFAYAIAKKLQLCCSNLLDHERFDLIIDLDIVIVHEANTAFISLFDL